MKYTIAIILSIFLIHPVWGADTNTTVSGTVVTDKSVPTASAPSVVVNNSDVCKSAYSAGVQSPVLGLSSGVTIADENCERIKLSRSLYGMGMKVAAISTLCQDHRVFDAMMMAGTPCPYEGKIGAEAKELWIANPQKRPDKEDFEEEYVAECSQEHNPNRDKIKNDVAGLISRVVISKTKSKEQCKKELYGG